MLHTQMTFIIDNESATAADDVFTIQWRLVTVLNIRVLHTDRRLMTVFIVSWWLGHCKSSLTSYSEYRLSAKRQPTLRPSQLTWTVTVSPPVGCYHLHPPSPFIIIITQPKAWYSFYHPTEGRRL